MPDKLFLVLVSPEKQLVNAEVDEVYAPGSEGDLGILPGHAPLVCTLRHGELHYTINGDVEYVAIDGGFLEVIDNKITVLADGGELGRDINLDEMLRRKQETEKALEEARHKDMVDFKAIEAKLMREIVRINVAQHYRE